MSSWSEPKFLKSSSETLKGGSEIVSSQNFGGRLQPLQHLATHQQNSNFSISVHYQHRSIEMMCGLLQLPHLPQGHTWFTIFQLSQTQSKVQLRSQCFKFGKDSLAHELKIFRVQFFICGVAPLLEGLDSTLVESCRNAHIFLHLVSLVSTQIELHASPLCARSLSLLLPLFFFQEDYAQALIYFWGGREILTY